jgi:hypothetical protein
MYVTPIYVTLGREGDVACSERTCIRRAQVKVGLINLCKGLFSLNARIYYKLKSGT